MPESQPATLAEAVDELTAAGYEEDFQAVEGGLRATRSDCLHEPEKLVIDRVFRFEGETDPDDEAVVFALHCRTHGTRGTYAVAYGSAMAPLDVEMVRRLERSGPSAGPG